MGALMIPIVRNSEEFYLLTWLPNWDGRYRVTLQRPVHVEPVVTGEEIRRVTADALRVSQEFPCLLTGDEARQAEEWLATLTNETVAVPFWPALAFARDGIGDFKSSLYVAFSSDFSYSEVFEVNPPAWAIMEGMICPLLFGRLTTRSITWDAPTQLLVTVAHTESGTPCQALRITPQTWELGPFHDPSTLQRRDLFPLRFNWASPKQDAVQNMETAEIGFGRDREEDVLAAPAREFSAEAVACRRAEVAQLIAFFSDHSSAAPFWIQSPAQQFTLARDIHSGQQAIHQPGHGVASGDWLSFSEGGSVVGFGKVARADDDGITLADPLPGMTAGYTFISRLPLVRFKADRLTIDFDAPDLASAQCDFRELSPETQGADFATSGLNLGAVAPKVWLYRLTTSTTIERWTSHESEVQLAGDEFLPGRIQHGDITSSITGSRDSVTITSGVSVSEIARAIIAREVFGRARVEIIEADRSEAGARDGRIVFSGEVESATKSGITVTLRCKPWPGISEVRIGRFKIQPTCNHVLYSVGCALPRDDWQFNAVMASPGGKGWPYVFGLSGLVRSSGGAPAYSANWFAGGWIEVGSDKIPVRASTVPAAGSMSITLARDPRPFPSSGDSVRLFPGCDGRWDTCRSKFANGLNFGGHPHVPISNPSLVKLSTAANGGKK